jgi:protein phosphatase
MSEPIAWGAATDVGRVRTSNEDAFVAEPMVFGVADGMGGHQAGEVASDIAARTLSDRLAAGATSVEVVVAAVVEANAAIFQEAHRNSEQRGMGTTLTAMAVLLSDDHDPRFAVVNVGDSRTYLLRGGNLTRVSVDHSYVQELVSTGHITEAEAREHPRRNIITRALGIEPSVRVDHWVLPLVRGDRFVLCSDGLVDEVDDAAITQMASTIENPQEAADAMVAAANANGGRDNVTVVVVDVLEGADPDHVAAELEVDPDWDDRPRLIDAEPMPDERPTAPRSFAAPAVDPTVGVERPAVRTGLGALLFGIALAAIAVLTVTLVLVVRHNSSVDPAPPTVTSSTTPASTTSTPTSTPTISSRPTSTTAGPSTTGG